MSTAESEKIGEELKKLEQAISEQELFKRAEDIINRAKKIMSTLYKLAFIATSDNPLREQAVELINEMKHRGLVSEEEIWKAMEDVKRWRSLVLDKIGRTF